MVSVTLTKEILLKPLQTVIGIIEKRHTMPILSNVLIDFGKNSLRVIGSDLEIQIETVNSFENEDALSVTTSAKKLIDILRALPDESRLVLEEKKNMLQIKTGKIKFQLQTLPTHLLPQVEKSVSLQKSLTLTQAVLRHLFQKSYYAMSNQDIRFYLNGVLLVLEENFIRMIATDGHRMTYIEEQLDTHYAGTLEKIIPRKTVLELIKLLENTNDPVEINLYENQLYFSFGNTQIYSKLIDGKFPDYKRLIIVKDENKKKISIDRLIFLQALQRVAILSSDNSNGVCLSFSDNLLLIESNNSQAEEACEEIVIKYDFEKVALGFNVSYLIDVLNNLQCEVIDFSFTNENESALITEKDGLHFKYIIMPMRI